jgi:hypothetical protein
MVDASIEQKKPQSQDEVSWHGSPTRPVSGTQTFEPSLAQIKPSAHSAPQGAPKARGGVQTFALHVVGSGLSQDEEGPHSAVCVQGAPSGTRPTTASVQ